MKRRILAMLLCGALAMSLAACGSSESSDEKEEVQGEETEKEQHEDEQAEEEEEDYDLVNTCLPYLAEQIGKMTYNEAVEYIEKTGYAYDTVEPSEEDMGTITTEDDEDGFHLYIAVFPDDDDNETVFDVAYGNGHFEGSASDDMHISDVTYKIYNVYEEEKSTEVSSMDDVLKFLNDEVPLLLEEHKDDGEGNEEIDVSLNATEQAEGSGTAFTIETNLPNGTELTLSLSGGDYKAQSKVTVEDGKAVSEAFSDKGEPLSGDYTLTVTSINAKQQPEEVQAVIGIDGEYLTGDLVSEGISGNNASAEFDFSF